MVGTVFVISCVFLYRFSPRKIEFLGYYHKIGAHRVNSLEKLESALCYFDAIELDLEYIEGQDYLDVNHPPASSIQLDFETYLSHFEIEQQPFIWLDIKNLNSGNNRQIHDKLIALLQEKSYPLDKILIETRYPEALPIFSASGFKTSFYLPQHLSAKDSQVLQQEIVKIEKVLEAQPDLGVSTTFSEYAILKKYFPARTKYIWSINHSKLKDYRLLQEILKDESVQLVLVSYRAFRGNR